MNERPPATPPAPLAPTLTADLFPGLGQNLIVLLRGLGSDDWEKPTVCSSWAVRDIAAHLLDSAYRRLGVERDGFSQPPEQEVTGYADLVAWLDRLNAEWVTACRRLSPRLLTDLLADVEPQLAAALAKLDPHGQARFPVSWAGEASSACWFDVARELTERWLHQQQIRLAVGAEPLQDQALSQAIFDTFLRALPHRYADTDAALGSEVGLVIGSEPMIGSEPEFCYTLRREANSWSLLAGAAQHPTTTVQVTPTDAWLVLSKGMAPDVARSRARIDGDLALARPFFETVAVMA